MVWFCRGGGLINVDDGGMLLGVVYHAIGTGVCFLDVLSLLRVVLADNFDPVGVWVEGECNMSHPPI